MHSLANFAAAGALEPVAFDSQPQHSLDVGYLVVGGQDEDSRGTAGLPVIVQHSLGNSKAVDVFQAISSTITCGRRCRQRDSASAPSWASPITLISGSSSS